MNNEWKVCIRSRYLIPWIWVARFYEARPDVVHRHRDEQRQRALRSASHRLQQQRSAASRHHAAPRALGNEHSLGTFISCHEDVATRTQTLTWAVRGRVALAARARVAPSGARSSSDREANTQSSMMTATILTLRRGAGEFMSNKRARIRGTRLI